MSVRGIVFDLDGTLVDSLADIAHAMNRAFAELSLPPVTEEQVRPALGHGALESVRAVAPDRTDDAFVTAVCRVYLEAYAADPAPYTRLYADAGTALPALRDAGIALGICTNKTTDLAWRALTTRPYAASPNWPRPWAAASRSTPSPAGAPP